ncbi:hypothetical protein CIB95_11800 [Lottiidibacillus patelloidae]|uniref:Uncharacterized protein n=1 Tax=Lottiidibacillus patelloidae TaxID=2670334 RepID=A0A263BSA0_9BACI|nr:hypothetical protein [Lottiidibacillus patelloidae]OZM56452.1 hypothetical protein CIB95_11800 [Lottiidibacillus patelloidae]
MIKNVKMGLSALLLLSFFLPWFSMDFLITDANISGFKLVEVFTSELVVMLDSFANIFYVLYLIPVLAVISLITAKSRVWSMIAGIFTLLICLVAVSMARDGAPIFTFLAYGGYLTFLSAIGLLVTSFLKVEDVSSISPSVEA